VSITHLPGVSYGPLPRVASAAGGLAWPPRLVVIHDTSNTATASAEAHYAATRGDAQGNWTSCHFYVDPGGPLGSSPLDVQAWAAYSYANQHGWHIEMCGMNAGRPNAVPAATVAITARLVAALCDVAGIPKVHLGPAEVAAGRSGVTGHWDITQGLHVGDHDDPGPAFNWAAFIAAVNQGGDVSQHTDDLIEGWNAGREVGVGANATEQNLIAVRWNRTEKRIADLGAAVAKLTAPAPVVMTDADRQAIANLVLAGIPHAPTAAEVADELQRRLQG
jgi:hypothetical protein